MRDQTLYALTEKLTRAVLQRVERSLHGAPLPSRLERRVEISRSRMSSHEVRVPEPRAVLPFTERVVEDVPELADVARHLEGTAFRDFIFGDADGNVATGLEAAKRLYDGHLRRFLILYMEKQAAYAFDEAAFGAVYDIWEEFLYRDTIEISFLAPVYNVRCPTEDVADVRFDRDECVLRPATEDDLQRMWRQASSGIMDARDLMSIEYVLESVVSVPKGASPDESAARNGFATAVTALRLAKPGKVEIAPMFHGPTHEVFGVSLTGAHAPFYRPYPGDCYVLEANQVDDLVRTYRHLSGPAPTGALKVAIDRFNFAYEKSRREDKLIDYWIALEALFLKREERQELGYRAALRMARFLGSSADERAHIFQKVKRSYSVRSSVVHGDPPPPDLTEITSFTGDELRSALRRAVLAGALPPVDRLDEEAARAETKEET